MASSRKRSSRKSRGRNADTLVARVAAQLTGLTRPGDRVAAALSGGVDSVVLLDVLHRLRTRLRIHLRALHVNHQLSPHAARWSAFCRRVCRAHGIPFRSVTVTVPRGDGVEASARSARYAVFFRQSCDHIVLAHHQDDQVETLLLQLFRGAGVKGLAAMPLVRKDERGRVSRGCEEDACASSRQRTPAAMQRIGPGSKTKAEEKNKGKAHPSILRPLLDITRAEIEAYARARRLSWVEDESNADVHFPRNFLRHEVLPAIAGRFPAYRATVARAARHLADSTALLDEVAAADAAGAVEGDSLAIPVLRALSPARARNLLRYFLAARDIAMPNTGRLDEALRQAVTAKRDARVLIDLGALHLRQFEGRLHLVTRHVAPPPGDLKRWRGEREMPVAELGGCLIMVPSRGAGLSLARLREASVVVRARAGGERMQPDRHRPRRTLKNLMQEARIPPWQRERLPLVFCGDDLAWVPAIGIDCEYQAAAGERAVSPAWRSG